MKKPSEDKWRMRAWLNEWQREEMEKKLGKENQSQSDAR
jgi:hypothetical protein